MSDLTYKLQRAYKLRSFVLVVLSVVLPLAIVFPQPQINELAFATGEISDLREYRRNGFKVQISTEIGEPLQLQLSNLTIEEIRAVRELRLGLKIDVWYLKLWYLHGLFGIESEVWQLQSDKNMVLAYERRLSEYYLVRSAFFVFATILGAVVLVLTLVANRWRRVGAKLD